jgi:hypothetical protein
MRCPQAGTGVAVKILIKQEVIAPVRIFPGFPHSAIRRTPAGRIALENSNQPLRCLLVLIEKVACTDGCPLWSSTTTGKGAYIFVQRVGLVFPSAPTVRAVLRDNTEDLL